MSVNTVVEVLEPAPAIRVVLDISTAEISAGSADPSGAVYPKSINVHVVEKVHRAFNEILTNFVAAKVGTRVPPRGRTTIVVVEVNATPFTLRPSIKPPDAEIRWPQVVVHHVEQHRDPTLVARIHESLQPTHATVGLFNGENMSWVVAPRKAARKFVDRHQLHGIDAKLHQVVETSDGLIKRVGGAAARKGAEMHLVNHEFIPVVDLERLIGPSEIGRVHQDGVAHAVDHLLGPRIRPPIDPAVDHHKLVLVSGFWTRNPPLPPTVGAGGQHVGVDVPSVEVTHHAD